jgi:hypothetical protein
MGVLTSDLQHMQHNPPKKHEITNTEHVTRKNAMNMIPPISAVIVPAAPPTNAIRMDQRPTYVGSYARADFRLWDVTKKRTEKIKIK